PCEPLARRRRPRDLGADLLGAAVGDRDADDPIPRERAANVGRHRPGAVGEGTAVDPDHDREPRAPGLRRPDVQVEAVIAWPNRVVQHVVEWRAIGWLWRCRTKGERVADARPGPGGQRPARPALGKKGGRARGTP